MLEIRVLEFQVNTKVLNLIHPIQVNTYNHKSKLVLVNAYQSLQYDQMPCNAYDDMSCF